MRERIVNQQLKQDREGQRSNEPKPLSIGPGYEQRCHYSETALKQEEDCLWYAAVAPALLERDVT